MCPSEEKLKIREPSDILTIKLRDQTVRTKKIKFEALCPQFSFFFPWTNEILKGYCPYIHIEDCRKAYHHQINRIEDGEKPDEERLYAIVTQNAITEEEKNYRKMLFRKYPAYPEDEQIYFN